MLSFVSALGGPTDIKSCQELFGRSRVYLKKPRTLWVVLKHAKNSVGRSWEHKKKKKKKPTHPLSGELFW